MERVWNANDVENDVAAIESDDINKQVTVTHVVTRASGRIFRTRMVYTQALLDDYIAALTEARRAIS